MTRTASSYPAPTGPYKVCVTRKGPWRDYDTARVQVSIGNPRYEGDKFRALCAWCDARFSETIIVVSDTLRRHNLLFQGMDAGAAHAQALADGHAWLARNAGALDGLRSVRIVRWDEALADPARRPIPATPGLTRALARTIDAFCARHPVQDDLNAAFRRHSEDFLREELSVFGVLFRKAAIDIYAGTWVEDLMTEAFPAKDYIAVDFTRNGALTVSDPV